MTSKCTLQHLQFHSNIYRHWVAPDEISYNWRSVSLAGNLWPSCRRGLALESQMKRTKRSTSMRKGTTNSMLKYLSPCIGIHSIDKVSFHLSVLARRTSWRQGPEFCGRQITTSHYSYSTPLACKLLICFQTVKREKSFLAEGSIPTMWHFMVWLFFLLFLQHEMKHYDCFISSVSLEMTTHTKTGWMFTRGC